MTTGLFLHLGIWMYKNDKIFLLDDQKLCSVPPFLLKGVVFKFSSQFLEKWIRTFNSWQASQEQFWICADKSENLIRKMDELPILALQEIFSFLSLPERLKCKRVSKRWKFAVENAQGIQALCIYGKDFPCRIKWCFSESEVIPEDTHGLDPEKFFNFNSRIELFCDLQKVCFFRVEISEFFYDLHLLSKLKVLMIDDFLIDDDLDHHITFDLNSLEKLSLKYVYYQAYPERNIKSIDFNTPSLSSLVFWNDYFIFELARNCPVKFRFPLTIRHLECIQFDSNLSVLKNLETLICQKIVVPFKLNDFKSLQRLELFPREEEELEYIRGIMEEKRSLRRDNLVITVCGFQDLLVAFAPGHQQNNTLFELNEHFLRQVADHSDKLVGHIPWQFFMNEFFIFPKTFKEIPKDFFFFKKFVHFLIIVVPDDSERRRRKRDTPDPSYVLQLLSQSNPEHVRTRFSFNRKFYEQLTSIQSIKALEITERFENLNLDHFLKLKNLRSFCIFTEKLPIDFISKLFTLRFMYDFFFSCSRFFLASVT